MGRTCIGLSSLEDRWSRAMRWRFDPTDCWRYGRASNRLAWHIYRKAWQSGKGWKISNGWLLLLLANGIALINMGRDSAALPFLEKARAIFEEANQPYFHVFTLVHLGNAELGLGNPEQARAWLEEGTCRSPARSAIAGSCHLP